MKNRCITIRVSEKDRALLAELGGPSKALWMLLLFMKLNKKAFERFRKDLD